MPETQPGGRIVFFGAVHEAVPALGALLASTAEIVALVTVPEEQGERLAGYVDLAPMVRDRGIPVFRGLDLRSGEGLSVLRALRPDLGVVCGWTRLIPEAALGVPTRGFVGFHASLLPRFRGRAPVNWAILLGESVTGNTMMFLAPGADMGDIVDQIEIDIAPDDTCGAIYARVGETGAEMLRRHLPALLDGTAARRPQPAGAWPALPRRTPDMGITSWNRTARQVHDWIRALGHPYPGAFGYVAGTPVRLWAAHVFTERRLPGAPDPGDIVGVVGKGVLVATEDGAVRLLRVQHGGGPEQTAAEWYAAQPSPPRSFDPVDADTARWALGLPALEVTA